MRITKAYMRQVKVRLQERIKAVYDLDEQHLENMLKNLMPGTDLSNNSIKDKTKYALLWSLEEIIPSSIVD